MNVLPSILGYGSSSSSSGTSGHSTPLSSFETSPRIVAPNTTETDGGKNLSFVQKLFASSNTCGTFSTPVICAANPCPVILNATCVFYEGPNLIYSGVNTNDSLQTIIEKFDYQLQQATAIWGNITGTVTNQTDLMNYLSNNYVSSVGLSMPSAFVVTNSPVTTTGTLTVTGAGNVYQYVRGDGTLGDFPGGGGGSSVSYYLNGSVNQGVIGGNTYYEMSKTAVIGSGTNFSISSNGYIAEFITDPGDPGLLNIPAGSWNVQVYMNADSAGGSPNFYIELYKYDGALFTLIGSSLANPEFITGGTSIDLYYTSVAVPNTVLSITDRLAIRVYVNNSGKTITLHTEGTTLGQVITTFSTGITALNGLTSQVQFLTTGTSGLDFNISSATSTHTFNLPVASAVNTGKLSNTDWSTFNAKVGGTGTINYLSKFTGSTSIGDSQIFDNGTNVGIGTTVPAFKLQVNGGDSSFNGVRVGRGLSGDSTNTAVGAGALSSITVGTDNVALGYFALSSATLSGNNIAIGSVAMSGMTSGLWNIGIGKRALQVNATSFNMAVGNEAMVFTTGGGYNTALGHSSLAYNTTGVNNTAIGYYSGGAQNVGQYNQTASNSVYIGYYCNAGGNGNNANEIVIGANTGGNGSNSATLGNTSITNTYLRGNINFNTVNAAIVDTDRFLVSDLGVLKYRTGSEVLSDIGAQGALTLTTTGTSGASTLIGNTLNIPQYQAVLTNPVTGTGTANYVTKWITSSTVGNSLIYDDGSAFAIGTTSINASALFQMDSTTKGFLPPRMTSAQRTAITSPAEGLIVFQTDGVIGLYIYANATWRSLTMV